MEGQEAKEIFVTEDTKITKQRIQRNDLNLQEASFRKFSKSAKVPSVLWSPSTWKIKVLPQGKFIQIWFQYMSYVLPESGGGSCRQMSDCSVPYFSANNG